MTSGMVPAMDTAVTTTEPPSKVLKVDPSIHAALVRAAESNRRSLKQEACYRLEQSLISDGYGPLSASRADG